MANDVSAQIAAMTAASQKAVIGGEIITQTLDALNSPMYGGKAGGSDDMADSYNFQKSVLSAVYSAKGAVVDAGS